MKNIHEIRRVAEKMVDLAWDEFEFDDNADGLQEAIVQQLRKHVVRGRGDE